MEKLRIRAETDYMAGMKYKEIAEKYEVSINTVKSWKKRYGWQRGSREQDAGEADGAHKLEDDQCTPEKNAPKTEKVAPKKKKGCKGACTPKQTQDGSRESVTKSQAQTIVESAELTDKQRLFCAYYIRCFNATKAYMKAYGCGQEEAMAAGCRMLRNVKVQSIIKELKEDRLNREMLTEEDIVQKYIDILHSDIRDYIDPDENAIDLHNPYADGTLVKKISLGSTASVELLDKMKALQWLSDHMDLATERQKAEIELLRSRAGGSADEDSATREAQDNISSILSQLKPIRDGDVCE